MNNHVSDLRILSIPAEHPYTQAICPAGVAYEPDPDIDGNWWPHPALEARYWATPKGVDVLHIHFGFEHRTPEQIAELTRAVTVPLVLTVHDIDNPHLDEQRPHHERLRILVQAAAVVITLTECAALRLRQQFGAGLVHVLPHPAVAVEPVTARREAIAGVFLKSLRKNVVSDPQFYNDLAARVPLRIFVHDEDSTRALREQLSDKAEVIVHGPLSDAALHREIAQLTVCVLPYARGTHSGWLEMCRDLGAAVAVPDIGCYAGQADCPTAVETYSVADAHSAATAVESLLAAGAVPYQGNRDKQLQQVRAAHAQIYEGVLQEVL